jgi:hypothetical protein
MFTRRFASFGTHRPWSTNILFMSNDRLPQHSELSLTRSRLDLANHLEDKSDEILAIIFASLCGYASTIIV